MIVLGMTLLPVQKEGEIGPGTILSDLCFNLLLTGGRIDRTTKAHIRAMKEADVIAIVITLGDPGRYQLYITQAVGSVCSRSRARAPP